MMKQFQWSEAANPMAMKWVMVMEIEVTRVDYSFKTLALKGREWTPEGVGKT